MLKLVHVNLLIELLTVKGLSVPIGSARLAAETYERLLAEKERLEKLEPKKKGKSA